jgi:hypothetical protein
MNMAKITLGKRPVNFKHKITVPLPEGGEGTIEVSYKYRTRTEFGKLIDSRMKEARERDESAKDAADGGQEPAFSLGEVQAKTRDSNAAYIMDIADGWDIDKPFGLEAVTQLCDELPGVAQAIINEYRTAIVEGRLGN